MHHGYHSFTAKLYDFFRHLVLQIIADVSQF